MANIGCARVERPRERLLALGAASLSDAELVALLLRTGAPGSSALDVARALITRFNGVAGLLAAGRFPQGSAPFSLYRWSGSGRD